MAEKAAKPLSKADPEDRSTIARLGGLTAAQNHTPEERSEMARKRGESTYAKHGKAHYLRMSLISHGRLPKKTK